MTTPKSACPDPRARSEENLSVVDQAYLEEQAALQ